MKKIKNLVILYPSFDSGGVATNLINFVNHCIKKNINIYLISDIKKNNQKKFFSKKVNFVNIGGNSLNFISKRLITSIFSIFSLYEIFKKIKKKDSITLSFQSHILPLIACLFLRRKIIIRNSEDSFEATKYADNKISALIILSLKFFFYSFSDGIITNSIKSKKSLQKITLKRNKIKLIYNPCIKKILKNKKNLKNNFILSVGRLCKQKNQEVLIKAFPYFLKKFPNYKLIIIGHGYDEQKLKRLTNELNIEDQVVFCGYTYKLKSYYEKSKLLILPSLYEGLPNTLIESVNYGLPCISSNCSGSEDILTKKYGIFTSRSDHKLLAKKMIYSLKNYKRILSNNKKIKLGLTRFLIEPQASKYLVYSNNILNN